MTFKLGPQIHPIRTPVLTVRVHYIRLQTTVDDYFVNIVVTDDSH